VPRPAELTLRPITADDEPFLHDVYAATRADELSRVPWTSEQRKAFVRQQFAAQHRYYQEHYAGAAFDVVLADGAPAGRLYVAYWPDEVRVIDVALLPAYRNRGLGTRLLRLVFAEADRRAVPVGVHVERFNPARRLYQRLGFEAAADRGVHLFLRRPPLAGTAAGAQPNTAS
jgi:GNAT superfamily N-acetyltransferase